MKRLLAVAIQGDWVGDWYEVRGDEYGAIAYPVFDTEEVLLEVERHDDTAEYLLPAGQTLFSTNGWLRYRVVKRCYGAAELSHTTVELLVNGKTPTQVPIHDSERTND